MECSLWSVLLVIFGLHVLAHLPTKVLSQDNFPVDRIGEVLMPPEDPRKNSGVEKDLLSPVLNQPQGPWLRGRGAEVLGVGVGRLGELMPGMDVFAAWANGRALLPAFVASLSMIIVSELGDKTFFIAALMAMRHSSGIVFVGAMGALGVMTVLSVLVGCALPAVLDRTYTHYASVVLFFIFGVKMAFEGWNMGSDEGAEGLAEVEAELNKKRDDVPKSAYRNLKSTPEQQSQQSSDDFSPHVPEGTVELSVLQQHVVSGNGVVVPTTQNFHNSQPQPPAEPLKDVNGGRSQRSGVVPAESSKQSMKLWRRPFALLERGVGLLVRQCLSAAFLQAFSLTFLAEWGDRSQIATIALAASKDPYGVTAGGLLGHGLCTGLAVVGGRMLAKRISERVVTLVGAALFTIFGIMGLTLGV